MRVLTTCFRCVWGPDLDHTTNRSQEELLAAHNAATQYVRVVAEPVSVVNCEKGHRFVLFVQDLGHAMLFERALFHLVDGNARDAVLDGYTALEMFLALVPVRARYDREKGAKISAIRSELAPALKTSDRAMASAMATVSLLTGKAPPSIPNALSEARNQAVHQGKSPALAKAEEHLVTIANVVGAFEDALDSQQCVNDPPFDSALAFTSVEELYQRDATAQGLKVASTSLATALAAHKITGVREPLQERIKRLKNGEALLTLR